MYVKKYIWMFIYFIYAWPSMHEDVHRDSLLDEFIRLAIEFFTSLSNKPYWNFSLNDFLLKYFVVEAWVPAFIDFPVYNVLTTGILLLVQNIPKVLLFLGLVTLKMLFSKLEE